jgi:hypothetical protein
VSTERPGVKLSTISSGSKASESRFATELTPVIHPLRHCRPRHASRLYSFTMESALWRANGYINDDSPDEFEAAYAASQTDQTLVRNQSTESQRDPGRIKPGQ